MSKARSLAADLRLAGDCARDARTLLSIQSRNAAYLASQAAEHLVRAVATSEDLHIERKDAHQLDTTIRRLPDVNADKAALREIAFLEIYATTYRYPTPSGRTPPMPPLDRITAALDGIEDLLRHLTRHFGIDPDRDEPVSRIGPRRISPRDPP